MTPTLLAYQIAPGKLGRMQVVCLRLGIRVQAVDPADFGQPIGALAGVLPRAADATAAPLPGEMLVMAHFRPGLLEGMLQGVARRAHPIRRAQGHADGHERRLDGPRALCRDRQGARRHAQRRPRAQGVKKFRDLQQRTD